MPAFEKMRTKRDIFGQFWKVLSIDIGGECSERFWTIM